jgi:hypothetical protein
MIQGCKSYFLCGECRWVHLPRVEVFTRGLPDGTDPFLRNLPKF